MFGRKTPYGFYSLFFFIGTALGAAVALLFAPTTGRKLQKQIKEVIEDKVEVMKKAVA
ncbi:MAG TPA: YtxH domain-containing protein [Thermoanaerobaculia bacterium]|nr:YtxH domain-containing protein [Thermoanaerobaculia bacterium]